MASRPNNVAQGADVQRVPFLGSALIWHIVSLCARGRGSVEGGVPPELENLGPRILVHTIVPRVWTTALYPNVVSQNMWTACVDHCCTPSLWTMSGTQYKIRCSEVLRDALKAAGADVVRGVLEERFLSEEQRRSQHVEVPAAIVEAVRRFGPEKAMDMMFAINEVASRSVMAIPAPPDKLVEFVKQNTVQVTEEQTSVSPMSAPAPRHPLEDEVTESGAPSWPGPYGGEEEVSDSAPAIPPRVPFVVQKAKVFSRTAEEQAERLKKLEGMLGLGGNNEQEP